MNNTKVIFILFCLPFLGCEKKLIPVDRSWAYSQLTTSNYIFRLEIVKDRSAFFTNTSKESISIANYFNVFLKFDDFLKEIKIDLLTKVGINREQHLDTLHVCHFENRYAKIYNASFSSKDAAFIVNKVVEASQRLFNLTESKQLLSSNKDLFLQIFNPNFTIEDFYYWIETIRNVFLVNVFKNLNEGNVIYPKQRKQTNWP